MTTHAITISIHGGVGSMNDPNNHTLHPGDTLIVSLIDYDVDTEGDEVQLDRDGDPFILVDEATLTVAGAPSHGAVRDAIKAQHKEIKREINEIELTHGEDDDPPRTNFLHGKLYGLRDALRLLNNPSIFTEE